MKAFNNFEKFDESVKLITWMRRILINTIIDRKRRKKLVCIYEKLPEKNHEIQLHDFALCDNLFKEINNLTYRQRQALTYVIREFSDKEACEELGIHKSTFRSRVFKGREKLKNNNNVRQIIKDYR